MAMLRCANIVGCSKQLRPAARECAATSRFKTNLVHNRRDAKRLPSKRCAVQDDTEPVSEKRQLGAAPDLAELPSISTQVQPASTSAKQLPYGLVSGLAAAGTIETAYLLLAKLTNTTPVCPSSGCESVLTSGYAELFGIPLPLLGALTYGAVGALAFSGWTQQREAGFSGATSGVDTALTAGAAALAATSASLMYVLFTKMGGEQCVWCLGSAGLSASILAAVTSGLTPQKLRDASVPALGAAAVTLAVLYLGWRQVMYIPDDFYLPYMKPPVSTQSTPETVDLARRLSAAGAKMYGAFWCTHCLEQKDAFGRQAMAEFPYVECYPDGWKKGQKIAPVCDAAGVKAFPSWVFGSTVVEGVEEFDELEAQLAKVTGQAPVPAAPAQ